MCIDIAWAFSGYRAMQGSISERDRRKFLYYSAYAWGSPAVISAVTALLEFAQGLPEHLLRPNFGKRTCWFYSKMATLAYFYGPMAALLLANVALFAYTTARIVRVQRETAVLSGGDSGRHDGGGGGAGGGGSALRGDRKRLMLYLKLFCLMGVTWITEIISWAEGSDGVYWYVTDAINLLRGLFIFVLFCCKPKVLKLLRRRVRELWLCAGGCWRSDGRE
ncbi:Probable G-protein coupled receptor Mth-like 1 [Gryllus bimaculatus]|nr:Probable G-protein coupled receptor Mth-like 1 [Gryllus bimaculatus]